MQEPGPGPTNGPASTSRVPREAATSIVPPVNAVGFAAPFRWLRRGWADFRAAGVASVFYGIVFACMGRVLSYVFSHAYEYVWALTSGFMLVGPFLALGLYDLSRRREQGKPLMLAPTLTAWRPNVSSLGVFGLVLGVLLLLWSRASLVVIAVSFPDQMPTFDSFMREVLAGGHLQFLAVYCAVGGLFASLVFATSVVSVPMMLDRDDSDGIVAALTSARSCAENTGVMLLWGCLITGLTGLGFALFHLGLIVVVPVIGHATWHAYREIVGAPRADAG
jgi:uncharacterized membrane protein